jgi:hypothetical protein
MKLFRVGHVQIGAMVEWAVWAEDDINARLYVGDVAQKENPRLMGEAMGKFLDNLIVHEVGLKPGVLFDHTTRT